MYLLLDDRLIIGTLIFALYTFNFTFVILNSMKRLLPFTIVFTTALAALLVIVVQPQQTALHKKRLKDMRQFLLAQTNPPLDCVLYLQEGHPEYYSACMGWQGDSPSNPLNNSGGNSNDGNQGTLTQTKESECLNVFDQSPFGPLRKTAGLPNTTRLFVNQICSYAENAIIGKYGSADLDAANRAIIKERDFALINTPAPDNQIAENYITKTVNEYLKDIRDAINEFAGFTANASYLSDPLPYIIGMNDSLHQKIVAIIQKYAQRSETPAPQENKIEKTLTPAQAIPVQPAASENIVVRAINKFIRILKANLLRTIREFSPQRRIFKTGTHNPKIISTKDLLRYYHDVRRTR